MTGTYPGRPPEDANTGDDTKEAWNLFYEDFTDNRLDTLSAYLDLHVEPVIPEDVMVLNGHVVRTAIENQRAPRRRWFRRVDTARQHPDPSVGEHVQPLTPDGEKRTRTDVGQQPSRRVRRVCVGRLSRDCFRSFCRTNHAVCA